jgi:GNAT superfamily N-acetyltransferase
VDLLDRAERFVAHLDESRAERVVDWPGGTACLHPGLPKIWDMNYMSLDDVTMNAQQIARYADDVMGSAGCEHRRVCVRDAKAGSRLERGFSELGWSTDVHVIMGHTAEPDVLVDTSRVEEVGDATWPSREEQLRSYPWADDDAIAQLRTLYALTTEAANARDFAIVEDGRAVSYALLYSDGSTGMIEDVATLEAYRGRGLSRAVVTRALEESRALYDFTFLIADDRDWPKHFYSKLGFEPLGRHYYFLKQPPGQD